MERRRHAHALAHALASICTASSSTTSWPTGRFRWTASRSAFGHPRADVRGRHRDRSRRALELGLQGAPACARHDLTFLLTSGGHNAGIVAGPVHPKRHYRIRTRRLADPIWRRRIGSRLQPSTPAPGPAWQRWLVQHSGGKTKPPAMGAALKGYRVMTMRRGSTCGNGSEDHRRQLARRQPVRRADDRPLSLRVVGRRAGLRRSRRNR